MKKNIKLIEPKLYVNNNWMVPYKIICCVD